jgi:4-diphosphocytidyl-2-C-methyl-D-erythritol kinase
VVAALALGERAGSLQGADIELEKRIPVAAGLGGGSADAAAVLSALNELWGCGLAEDQLMEVAAEVGSDVPATLAARPVLVAGRGERLKDASVPELHWVVVPAGFHVRTPDAFRWWDEDGGETGPDPAGLVAALTVGDISEAARAFFNDLEEAVFARHPELASVKERLAGEGALASIMCGSGPTMAGLFPDALSATAAARAFQGAIVAETRGTA